MDKYTKIDIGEDLTNWVWVYYGYDRAERQTIAYARFADREVV